MHLNVRLSCVFVAVAFTKITKKKVRQFRKSYLSTYSIRCKVCRLLRLFCFMHYYYKFNWIEAISCASAGSKIILISIDVYPNRLTP